MEDMFVISRNCLRRIARHDDTEFSNQSIMNSMEKFVKVVNDMDETILVPCRLMDLKVGDDGDTVVEKKPSKHPGNHGSNQANGKKNKINLSDMASTDLYNLYAMINSVKNELLWGQNMVPDEDEKQTSKSNNGLAVNSNAISSVKGHVRRPSTVSMTSTNSTASISDSDSDTGNENDSGIEAEDNRQEPNYALQIAENFRRHLHGLQRSLQQMTEAAVYLSARYQNDVGGAV